MEAFNVSYCGIDLNQAIGNLSFESTQTYAISSMFTHTHTVTHDICTIQIAVGPLISNFNGWSYAITSTKDGSFNSISIADSIFISKSGNTITMGRSSGAQARYTVTFVISEFDFA